MTSFNEGDINRDSDGKFAAMTTGEADLDLCDDIEVACYNPSTKTYAAMSVDDQHE